VSESIGVLFVCTANICRSAYAEVMARHLLGGRRSVEVASAGVHGFVDHPVEEEMAAQLAARGVDSAAFRSRRLTMDMVDRADLVLTAELSHRSFILDERPAAFRRTFTLGQFADVVEGLNAHLTGRDLLAAAAAGLKPARAVDDVPDPYRRGTSAAGAAADHLDRLLTPIVERLAAPPADSSAIAPAGNAAVPRTNGPEETGRGPHRGTGIR
jgi:sulfate adenylyltransferase